MEIGYVIKGKRMGEKWKSQVYDDAEDCDQDYYDLLYVDDYSDLKKYTVYMHYELWK